MKTLEDFKQEQMKDEDFKREYDEIQLIASNRAIKELESLKAEIDGRKEIPNDFCIKEGMLVFKSIVDEIIDNHIKELKGESK